MTHSITVIDGGMGKELERMGAPFQQPEWSAAALIEDPEAVLDAHENFIDAGAEIITTNSYAVVPFHLGEELFAERGRELAELAGEVARQAADDAERPVLVAGSLPPLFGSYKPDEFDPDRAPEILEVLVDGLGPHVDFWIAETISSLAEFDAVVDALDEYRERTEDELELWASFTVADDLVDGSAVLRSGESIEKMVTATEGRCSALLFNCSKVEATTAAVQQLSAILGPDPVVPFGAYANAFPDRAERDYASNVVILSGREDLTPERYAEIVAGWVDEGATIVGGCCNIHPEHIAELNVALGGMTLS